MKEKFGQFKEFVGNLSRKVKIMIIVGAVLLIGGAVTVAVILNNQPYTELFSGLGQEEMQQIAQKLTEDGIDYKFNGESTIMVKKDTVDQTKATLVQAGYPKNGFTYDTFKDNASMLTTDSDKKTYKLYELQDRIGSTIRLFDGVLFSAEVKCMKPQKEMYGHLFERFGLRPEECFFIDDQPLNIEGGRACGMDGYCFDDGNAGTLRRVIEKLR